MNTFSTSLESLDMRWAAVRTTNVYCRPSCGARTPLRKNVEFFDSATAAEAAGFRPCKRCRPNEAGPSQRETALVATACKHLESAEELPTLHTLAQIVKA